MSIFDAYDQEYAALTRDISKNISDIRSLGERVTENNSAVLRHTDALMLQAQDLIKQMEIELRGHDAGTRKALGEKVTEYKKSLTNLKADYEKAKDTSQRSALIGSKSGEQRERLLNTNDKINRQNDIILNAQRTVADTEEVGMEITRELSANREKIQSSHAKVHEFSGITESSRRVISSIQKRETQQKLCMGFVGVAIITAIILTIYYVSKNPKSSDKKG